MATMAVVYVKGPVDRWVCINDSDAPQGQTNEHYPVEVGENTFELKKSAKGPAYSVTENVTVEDPPMEVDLTPPASSA